MGSGGCKDAQRFITAEVSDTGNLYQRQQHKWLQPSTHQNELLRVFISLNPQHAR
jgi:hypothetical protein